MKKIDMLISIGTFVGVICTIAPLYHMFDFWAVTFIVGISLIFASGFLSINKMGKSK